MATKDLDPGNVIKQVYDPATESIKANITGSSGPIEVTATTPIPVTLGGGTGTVLLSQEITFTSIPDGSSTPFEITPSLSGTAFKIMVYDTTGTTLQLRTGAVTGNLLALVGPGQDQSIDVTVASGTRITIRSNGSAPTAGTFIITIIGT